MADQGILVQLALSRQFCISTSCSRQHFAPTGGTH